MMIIIITIFRDPDLVQKTFAYLNVYRRLRFWNILPWCADRVDFRLLGNLRCHGNRFVPLWCACRKAAISMTFGRYRWTRAQRAWTFARCSAKTAAHTRWSPRTWAARRRRLVTCRWSRCPWWTRRHCAPEPRDQSNRCLCSRSRTGRCLRATTPVWNASSPATPNHRYTSF